ncbi:four-carbon acid sugar kinase family protein [Croceitalea marina]|uniref:Four-carbon acid sugar kinase family protein n=1 Tax=Croceitalea marina TaxID=1775166 RepID=A0ABW5MXI2_9FLAO
MIAEEIRNSITEGKLLDDISEEIKAEFYKKPRVIVILDDDPTGTQTVHDVPIITEWSEETLSHTISNHNIFFILTNSRSLHTIEAYDLGFLLGKRLRKITELLGKTLIPISRSDSTLRGHYPIEIDGLKKGLDWAQCKEVFTPAFFEGGRYTFNDIHYVKEGKDFIPVSQTPFAQDNTFGFKSSNLREWVQEKTENNIKIDNVGSVSIQTIRKDGIIQVTKELSKKEITIINATSPYDLQVVALASLKLNKDIVYRTAASFINAISSIRPKLFKINTALSLNERTLGGLTIIGSYVPKTTAQLNYLKNNNENLAFLEFKVNYIHEDEEFQKQIQTLSVLIDSFIKMSKDVVLYTTREVFTGATKTESLNIVNRVSSGLVGVVQNLTKKPKYLIAKGGITSSDIAVKGLGVKSAVVAGQAIPGVPVWILDTKSAFPGMPYIVFPGNVGDETALHQLILELS